MLAYGLTPPRASFLDAEGGDWGWAVVPVLGYGEVRYSDSGFYAWRGGTTVNYFDWDWPDPGEAFDPMALASKILGPPDTDVAGIHHDAGQEGFMDGAINVPVTGAGQPVHYGHTDFWKYFVDNAMLSLTGGYVLTPDALQGDGTLNPAFNSQSAPSPGAPFITAGPLPFANPNPTNIANGDLEYESAAGWFWHGGGGAGVVRASGGNWFLELDGTHLWREHNWMLVPADRTSLQFDANIQSAGGTSANPEYLRVVYTGRSGSQLVWSMPLHVADPAWGTTPTIVLPAWAAGDTGRLKFFLEPAAGQGAVAARVQIDNVRLAPGNQAPVLDNTGNMSLAAIAEDDLANSGISVPAIIASAGGDRITDANGDPEGLAIVVADTSNGSWQFTTDGGATWTAMGTVSSSLGRLLAANANTKLRFQPNLNWNGTISSALTFRAWDQTSGNNGGTADASNNGGATAFSTTSETASITVNPVNDPPVATNNTRNGNEDEPIAVAMPATDVDSASLTFTVTSGPLHGTVDPGSTSARIYHPESDWNGTDSFKFKAYDGQAYSQEATVTITVAPVNDRPSFIASNPPEVRRGAGPQVVPNWAAFNPGPANESSQTVLNYTIRNISNSAVFAASPAVALNGTLTFTPSASAIGRSTFEVLARDNGGTANGGVDTSNSQTFTIVVNGIYPDDAARFAGTRRTAHGWELQIQGRSGAKYDLLTSPNLRDWTIWTNVTCIGGTAQLVDTATGSAMRFYRAVLVP